MRYLPAQENRGAGQLWNGVCASHDGGEGNALPANRQPSDSKLTLYSLGPLISTSSEVNGQETTWTETYDAKYTRAVWSLAFAWNNALPGGPDKGNAWGMSVNPCWPSVIASDDPAWALMTDDPWYRNGGSPPACGLAAYKDEPPLPIWSSANTKLVDMKLPAIQINGYPTFNYKGSGNRLMKRELNETAEPEGWTPRGRSLPKISVKIVDGQFAVRDDETGTSHIVAPEELDEYDEIELEECADRFCTEERRQLANDQWVYMPGPRRSMSPPAHVEAVSTSLPVAELKLKREAEALAAGAVPGFNRVAMPFGRRSPQHNLPKPTAVV